MPITKFDKPQTIVIDMSIRGLIGVTTLNGQTTKIAARKIIQVVEHENGIIVRVVTKSGLQKAIFLEIAQCPKKHVLLTILNDELQTNEIHKRHSGSL